jgi:hypothetical protein
MFTERRQYLEARARHLRLNKTQRADLLRDIGLEVYRRKTPNIGPLLTKLALADKERGQAHDASEPEMTPEPIVEAVHITEKMMETEEKEDARDHGTVVSGCVYVTTVAPAVTTATGSSLFSQPLSPIFFGSSRLATIATLYDLYRFRNLVFEWVPMCPTTTPGALVGYCEPDVMADPLAVQAPGAANVRDAMARPGAEANSVFERVAYGISYPQQAWYFCDNNDAPNLAIAGLFNLVTVGSIASATVGMLICHYEVEFVQATQNQIASVINNAYPTSAVCNFGSVALTGNAAFYCPLANFPVSGLSVGLVGCATIAVINDSTSGTIWRTVFFGDTKKVFVLQPGTRVWFRLEITGVNVMFYPSLGGAIGGQNASVADQWGDALYVQTSATPSAGTSMTIDNIELLSLPPL